MDKTVLIVDDDPGTTTPLVSATGRDEVSLTMHAVYDLRS